MFEQLSNAIAEKSEIIAPSHQAGEKDLGIRTVLETEQERFQFELALLCVAVQKLQISGAEEPWLQSWRPEVRAALHSVPSLDTNPLVVTTRKHELWVPSGHDLRDRLVSKLPGPDYDARNYRYLGFAAEYLSGYLRKLADQFPHVDGTQSREFERGYTRIVGMRSFQLHNKGTYVGRKQAMFTATREVLQGNRRLMHWLFPKQESGRVAVAHADTLDGDAKWYQKDAATRVIRRFVGVSMKEFAGFPLHVRRFFMRRMLDILFERAHTPIAHLKLPPGDWAFFDEAQVAHGRYDARGDLLALNL